VIELTPENPENPEKEEKDPENPELGQKQGFTMVVPLKTPI